MTRFETSVEIAAAPDAVFAYVADPRHFPAWNSAVQRVAPVEQGTPAAGRRYVMRRVLPTGPATNELEIVTWSPPDELVIRTLSGPTPFTYRYAFTPTAAGTRVMLHGDVRLGGAASALGPLAAPALRRGVDANLATLRGILGGAATNA